MKRQYPFFVLNITMPTETVDVNVHPNKIDVRFSNNQIVYGTIYNIISKVLDGNQEALNIVVNDKENNHINTSDNNINYDRHNSDVQKQKATEKFNFDELLFCDNSPKIDFNKIEKQSEADDIFAQNKAYLESLEKKKQESNLIQDEIKLDRELKYIGQALNTFLIFEDGIDLYFIDQHAAHERIKYDSLIEKITIGDIEIQPLLVPFIFKANDDESDFLYYKSELFKSMGLVIEEFGRNTFRITTIPAILFGINLKDFIQDLLSDLNVLKDIEITDLLKENIAQKACKSAIKAGDKLSDEEVKELISLLKGNLGLKCPHGRPIAIKITRTEIDKWFKRIV